MDIDQVHDDVKEYYGTVLQSSKDLKTNVCTIGTKAMPKYIREAIASVHEDVTNRFYGCGLVIPEAIQGTRVLDLGSGSGLDCFALSKLVGETGHVTGVDMTAEQLAVANRYIDYHTEKFGYEKPNVDFVKGYLEKLSEAGVKKNHYDVIISNCVVNLVADKRAVLREAHRALKVGGEMYFSDIYSDRQLSEEIRKDKVLWGECISGALWWKDLHTIAQEVGFSTPRLVSASYFEIFEQKLKDVLGDAKFVSAEYRLFKLPETQESHCSVIYDGSVPEHEEEWTFDLLYKFKKDEPTQISCEVATILKASRFAEDLTFEPAQKKTCADAANKDEVIDPFAHAEVTKQSRPATVGAPPPCCGPKPAGGAGGCCDPKPTGGAGGCCDPQPTRGAGGCGGPKPTGGAGGCCDPRPTGGAGGCCDPQPTGGAGGCGGPKPTGDAGGCCDPKPTGGADTTGCCGASPPGGTTSGCC